MRIISQGGHVDLPYERTHLCSNTENVMARCDGKEYLMGIYSTHEKAFKAIKMCREWYTQCVFTRAMIPETANDLNKMSMNMAEKAKDQICRTFIFQFPADEEV